MTDPFDFRWGPSRLVGLGVHLGPDQAAATEVPGFAIAVAPIFDPVCEEPLKMYGSKNQPLHAPAVLATKLNEVVPVIGRPQNDYDPRTIQDELDEWEGEEWRNFAQVVGDPTGGMTLPCGFFRTEDLHFGAWDAVLVDAATAKRFTEQADRIWRDLKYDELDHWKHMAEIIGYDGLDELSDLELDEWQQTCASLGTDWEEEPYSQQFKIEDSDLEPEWRFDDADLNKIWASLTKSSQKGWAALQRAQPAKQRNSWMWQNRMENPWS
jgi:hypothetical protein